MTNQKSIESRKGTNYSTTVNERAAQKHIKFKQMIQQLHFNYIYNRIFPMHPSLPTTFNKQQDQDEGSLSRDKNVFTSAIICGKELHSFLKVEMEKGTIRINVLSFFSVTSNIYLHYNLVSRILLRVTRRKRKFYTK